jgi:hypothetical protein
MRVLYQTGSAERFVTYASYVFDLLRELDP